VTAYGRSLFDTAWDSTPRGNTPPLVWCLRKAYLGFALVAPQRWLRCASGYDRANGSREGSEDLRGYRFTL